jgi:DNA helicase HerA-like ATPase
VFDLSRYPQEEVKLTAGSFILKKIYNEMFLWGKSERLRLSLILDEAHRLASDPTIPKLMKEGRKYGVSLLLASQNLDDFAPEVVQNAGLRVAFRNNHPASRKIASLLNQRDSINLAHQIERLGVGTAIVVTETIKNPRVTRMRRIDS